MDEMLVKKLRGGLDGPLTAADRLRMFVADPETFPFSVDDAFDLDGLICEAADRIEALASTPTPKDRGVGDGRETD